MDAPGAKGSPPRAKLRSMNTPGHVDALATALAPHLAKVPPNTSVIGGFTLMKKTSARGRTRNNDENAILVTTAGGWGAGGGGREMDTAGVTTGR